MDQEDKIEDFYRKLYDDEFILTHDFQRMFFGEQEFFACASTLKSRQGREITVSFNVHCEAKDEVELVIQLLNQTSLEQIKIVGTKISQKMHKDISVYEEPGCISMVSYHSIDDIDEIIEMFKVTLEEVNKVLFFVVNP